MFRFIWAWLIYTWGGLHRYFGNKNNLRREHEAAVRCFTRAYEVDPTFRRVLLERGVLMWRELGQHQAAKADFDALLGADPNYAPALLNRAMVSQDLGQFRDAINDLEHYLSLDISETQFRQEAQRTAVVLKDMVNLTNSD